jgi:hypothetical protein
LRNTEETKEVTTAAVNAGRAFYFAGWAVFALSILLALSGKTSEPHYVMPFWVSFGVLVAASLVYFVGCLMSARWRSKVMARYFSSYLSGACGWLIFFLLFWILDRVAG